MFAITHGATTAKVTGLTNGTNYAFTVIAFNEAGASVSSAVSAAVTPTSRRSATAPRPLPKPPLLTRLLLTRLLLKPLLLTPRLPKPLLLTPRLPKPLLLTRQLPKPLLVTRQLPKPPLPKPRLLTRLLRVPRSSR
jgi:hypothetical protein